MKKILSLAFALLFLIPSPANAQGAAAAPAVDPANAMRILPVPPDSKPANLFGQNHYYTVTLRGNGEAVVTFKAILSNTGSTPIGSVTLQLPANINPADIIAYQVIQEPQCVRYIPQTQPDVRGQTTPPVYKEVCAEYQEPNYQYLYGNTQYLRINTQAQNNTVQMQLPSPIEPNKNGSYFVYYRTNAIVTKDLFGAYDYTFVTSKIDDKIHTLQVGISTDADHILRGADAQVNYNESVAMAALPAADTAARGVSSPQFDQFYNQIGSGTIIKQSQDLANGETYEVKGTYAESQAKLYGKELATGIGIILFIIIITLVAANIVMRKLSKKKADKPEEAVVQLKNRNKTFLIAISISFVSMLLVSLYTFGIYAMTQLLNPNMYYGYSNNESILSVFIFAVSALVYLFFFFAPAVGMGIKKGMGWALVTFAATVVWAVLFLLVLFITLFFFSPNNNGYPKAYPAMSFMEGRAAPAAAVDMAAPASEPQTLEVQPAETKPLPPETVKDEVIQSAPVEKPVEMRIAQ